MQKPQPKQQSLKNSRNRPNTTMDTGTIKVDAAAVKAAPVAMPRLMRIAPVTINSHVLTLLFLIWEGIVSYLQLAHND